MNKTGYFGHYLNSSILGAGGNPNDMYKLKTTVQTLEASLSKKNKEIAELKKSRNEDDNSSQNLGEFLFLHDLLILFWFLLFFTNS